MPELSVTATENAIMLACLSEGKTEIRLAAAEPHVQDLCHFLNKMGAKIRGIGTYHLCIEGVKNLKGITHRIIGDYLEAGTFAIAAAITQGDVIIKGVKTNIDFHSVALDDSTFKTGQYTTDFLTKRNIVKKVRERAKIPQD